MAWSHYVAYFFGGLFVTNAIPHLLSGIMGRPFQSPFAKPSGEGYSSSTINVVWGVVNLAIGYVLVFHVGTFDVRDFGHVGAFSSSALLISLFCANHFGKFNGGNQPLKAQALRDSQQGS